MRATLGEVEIVNTPPRPGDFGGKRVSSERARAELGWVARTPFAEGVSRYVEWRARDNGSSRAADCKVLVLTADIGEGHDLPARMIADELDGRAPRGRGHGARRARRDGLAHAQAREGQLALRVPLDALGVRVPVLPAHPPAHPLAGPEAAHARGRPAHPQADRARGRGPRGVHLPGQHRGAGRAAPPRQAEDAGLRGDHRPGRAPLVGAPGRGHALRDPPGVDPRGGGGRRRGQRALGAAADPPGLPTSRARGRMRGRPSACRSRGRSCSSRAGAGEWATFPARSRQP